MYLYYRPNGKHGDPFCYVEQNALWVQMAGDPL